MHTKRLLRARHFVLSEERLSVGDSSLPSSSRNAGEAGLSHAVLLSSTGDGSPHLHALQSTFLFSLPSHYLFHSSHTFKYFQMYMVVCEHTALWKIAPF